MEVMSSLGSEDSIRADANLTINIHLLQLAFFEIAVIGTGIATVRDIMSFAIPPYLKVGVFKMMMAGTIALYFQGAKESDIPMSAFLVRLLWYVFSGLSIFSTYILATNLPLDEIIALRRKKLNVAGRSVREKAFRLGPEEKRNTGNQKLPKVFGHKATAYEKEISVQRKKANAVLAMQSKGHSAGIDHSSAGMSSGVDDDNPEDSFISVM